ncbi:hypothetical protein C8A00DRAFT_44389 [Chaetomidium leptoderma]|uniref:Zn(2)-C6 fungal-type domain-containing protein n=1 Tax=Chaetomidium leptoderma TaxID=669021 RepID=A0AAN6VJU0_9PEZI|nr:hypothetical protein C8A00DRAFT_44389 [Chaetomidium leptoderma]
MDGAPRRVEKRNRPPLSCEPCRARKSKCNRASPCDSCVKRHQPSSCHYVSNVRRSEASSSKKSNLADRLRSLEALVSSFAAQDTGVQQREPTDGDSSINDQRPRVEPGKELSPPLGSRPTTSSQGQSQTGANPETPRIRQTHDGHVNFIDSSHWLSILEDIREVREHLSPEGGFLQQDVPSSSGATWGPELPEISSVLGLRASISLENILASLPPRPVCDRLLSHYFNSRFQVLGIIHRLEFQNEYESFWEQPSQPPPLWIALLFSVLGMAAILLRLPRAHEQDNGSLPSVRTLQQRTAECLILGRFATANAHALEAFVLHVQSRFLSEGNSAGTLVHLWFEMGTIIRLAFRMGYHRDPSEMPGITPFQGEMRRRVWVNIFQVDALMSFQMGFPSMISTEYCDARPPSNLEDSDFRAETDLLPPSRPLTYDTPIVYIIAKASVMGMFKKIVAHTQSLASPTYDRTISLDLELRDAYSRVPDILQRRDVGRCFLDTSTRIIERCNIELLYLKSTIILHRRFVNYEPATPSLETSRRACAEAALDILARQADLSQASQPGGRLYEDRWMLASLMVHDFLLAAMVLCLDLSVRLRFNSTAEDLASRAYMALHTSRQVWAATSSLSPEAHTAAFALDLMLKKVSEKNGEFLTQHASLVTTDLASLRNSGLLYADLMSDVIDGAKTPDWVSPQVS